MSDLRTYFAVCKYGVSTANQKAIVLFKSRGRIHSVENIHDMYGEFANLPKDVYSQLWIGDDSLKKRDIVVYLLNRKTVHFLSSFEVLNPCLIPVEERTPRVPMPSKPVKTFSNQLAYRFTYEDGDFTEVSLQHDADTYGNGYRMLIQHSAEGMHSHVFDCRYDSRLKHYLGDDNTLGFIIEFLSRAKVLSADTIVTIKAIEK